MEKLKYEHELRVRENFYNYIHKYGQYYPPHVLSHIIARFMSQSYYSNAVSDVEYQVYSAIGVYDYQEDCYDKSIKDIKETYDLNVNILEVGCGYYPRVAEKISKIQTTGRITVMDPRVIPVDNIGVRINRAAFDKNTEVRGYNLIIGIMPCEATVPIIESACKNDIDMYIQVCDCIHFPNSANRPRTQQDLVMWYLYLAELEERSLPRHRKYEFTCSEITEKPVLKIMKK